MSRRCLLLLLLSAASGLSGSAAAAPLSMDLSEAVSEPRRDPGSGLCGAAIKYGNQPQPLVTIDDATALLDKPAADPSSVGKQERLFQGVNLSMGVGSEADFAPTAYVEDAFPYCQDPRAMPQGADDNNIALRLRGYLNVTNPNGGQPITFALRCDDGCALFLGKSRLRVMEANDDSPQLTGRRARRVTFRAPGLYPVELIYFQNASNGYFEWSQARGESLSSDDLAVDDLTWGQNAASFRPLFGNDLYSSVVGSSASCKECSAAATCDAGAYCGDGLCQACVLPDHCGSSCMRCPADRRICSAGKCVQCTSDAQCPPGSACDLAIGTCAPPVPCTTDAQCTAPRVCRPHGFCDNPPTPCSTAAECLPGQACQCDPWDESCAQTVCGSVGHCNDDINCGPDFYCSVSESRCRLKKRFEYTGGCSKAELRSDGKSYAQLAAALFAAAVLLLRARRRTRTP